MKRRAALEATAVVLMAILVLLIVPRVVELYVLMNLTSYFSVAVFALSLALVWGYGGIVSYGQAAFFGLGAYAYAIAGINFGDTTLAIPIAIVIPAAFAALVGYFVFYARLSSVFVSIITLSVSLILFKLFNSTAGHGFKIGKAALGGFNGISNTLILNWPFNPSAILSPEELFYVSLVVLTLGYLLCKWLLGTRFGRAVIAVRDNEARAEYLGYNSKALKLGLFVIGAAIAGVSGVLYANSVYVSPNVFGLATMAQSLIWVVVGGLGTLIGGIFAAIGLSWLTGELGADALVDPNIVLGLILIVFVRFVPNGIVPTIERIAGPLLTRRGDSSEMASGASIAPPQSAGRT